MRTARRIPRVHLDDVVHGGAVWQPAHAQHAAVAGVVLHRGSVAVEGLPLLVGARAEALDVALAHLLPVGPHDAVYLARVLERDEGLARCVVKHGHRLGRHLYAKALEEFAHLSGLTRGARSGPVPDAARRAAAHLCRAVAPWQTAESHQRRVLCDGAVQYSVCCRLCHHPCRSLRLLRGLRGTTIVRRGRRVRVHGSLRTSSGRLSVLQRRLRQSRLQRQPQPSRRPLLRRSTPCRAAHLTTLPFRRNVSRDGPALDLHADLSRRRSRQGRRRHKNCVGQQNEKVARPGRRQREAVGQRA